MLFTIPNILTFSRILVIPILAVMMSKIEPALGMQANYWLCFWAMIIFAFAGFTDLVDGYYARKLGSVTTMGQFFDPMADKLIHMTALVMLIPLDRVPAWIVVILLAREIFVSGLRAVAASDGMIIAAATWGKRKTAWLNIGIGGLILYYPVMPGSAFEINTLAVAYISLAMGFLYSVASALAYSFRFFNKVRK